MNKNEYIHHLFNSHPHKEDDEKHRGMRCEFYFSTHILTRRMTTQQEFADRLNIFSTHILTRRMTYGPSSIMRWYTFQLTSSQGG